jgi:palmitoyltransferase
MSSDASRPARARQGGAVAAVFVTFVLDVAFAASLLGFIIMHANLNLSNMTTIEMYEKKKTLPWRYNLGQRKNFEEVFGKSAWWWLIPAHSADQLRRLLDISRVSGGTYPDMESDGLDRDAGPSVGGQESTGLDGGGTCGTCV